MRVMTVPTVIVIALIVAIIIYQLPMAQGFFRGTVYFPLIMPDRHRRQHLGLYCQP